MRRDLGLRLGQRLCFYFGIGFGLGQRLRFELGFGFGFGARDGLVLGLLFGAGEGLRLGLCIRLGLRAHFSRQLGLGFTTDLRFCSLFRLGFGKQPRFGRGARLGLAANCRAIGGRGCRRGRTNSGNDVQGNVVALGLDLVVGSLAQGEHDARARAGAFVFGHAGRYQAYRVRPGVDGNVHIAETCAGQLDHHAGWLFQLPGGERRSRRRGNDHRRLARIFRDANGLHAHGLGGGRCGPSCEGQRTHKSSKELGSFPLQGH